MTESNSPLPAKRRDAGFGIPLCIPRVDRGRDPAIASAAERPDFVKEALGNVRYHGFSRAIVCVGLVKDFRN